MTDKDVDVTTGEREIRVTHRLFHGFSPNIAFPIPSFSFENQELRSVLATGRDVDVPSGERERDNC